eukprot:7388221-Prymnesium_polylepis.1
MQKLGTQPREWPWAAGAARPRSQRRRPAGDAETAILLLAVGVPKGCHRVRFELLGDLAPRVLPRVQQRVRVPVGRVSLHEKLLARRSAEPFEGSVERRLKHRVRLGLDGVLDLAKHG